MIIITIVLKTTQLVNNLKHLYVDLTIMRNIFLKISLFKIPTLTKAMAPPCTYDVCLRFQGPWLRG